MKKSDFKIAFCYNVQPDQFNPDDDEKFAEFDSVETVQTVLTSLKELGFNIIPVDFNESFVEKLKQVKPDLVFNIVEGFRGEDRETQAPAIYEYLGLPYTGAGPLAHALALNKVHAKYVMEYKGVRTAPFQLFEDPITDLKQITVSLPAIVKPVHEGSSIGVHNDALVKTKEALQKQVNYLLEKYKQAALVEKFINGREFNQAIIGNKNPVQFPIVEIDYSYLPPEINKFSSYEVKTSLDDPNSTICPARITPDEAKKISQATLAAYHALGIRDYARIDLRLGDDGNVYILEINAVPGIAPGIKENNSMPKAIRTFGWKYTQMIEAIINAALERYGIKIDQ
jgi:D-alanine-D-alanine ligase